MSEINPDAIIRLTDDTDKEIPFEHLLTFEYGDELFVAFTPIDNNDGYNVGEVLIMRVDEDPEDDENDTYLPIDTEDELMLLWDVFKELYYGEEEFEDDEDDGEEDEYD